MSEYWKSTPKYWCKFCKTYVRDTKFERQQHEATGKHQGSIQRSLRDLHRGQEREAKEKQRAKDEVARLNATVGNATSGGDAPWKRKAAIPPPAAAPQVTPEERKRQLAQLAEMGIAIPQEYRGELAMAGDWQTVSETAVRRGVKKAEEDVKPDVTSTGVRKRKAEDGEDHEDGQIAVRRGWGLTYKTQPAGNDSEDLETLFGGSGTSTAPATSTRVAEDDKLPAIKKEESQGDTAALAHAERGDTTVTQVINLGPSSLNSPKTENEASTAAIVFKKRKTKSALKT